MSEYVRVGIIGTSQWADWIHLPALRSQQRARLVAICGRARDRAQQMATKYGIPQVFTDYREMIEKADLHAVVIASPDDLHYPMTMDALDAGLHVMCEKPLAISAEQARRMYERAQAVGVKHTVFFTYRWLPHYRYLKALVDDGYVGRCYGCEIHYLSAYGLQPDYRWRWDGNRSLGALADLGSHAIDLARWLAGDISRVCGRLATFVERRDPDGGALDAPNSDEALAGIEFANGAQGAIQVSRVCHLANRGMQQSITLHGEAGTLVADLTFLGSEISGARSGDNELRILAVPKHMLEGVNPTSPVRSQFTQVFAGQPVGHRRFFDAILEDRPISPSFHDGLKVQEVIDAVVESHTTGRWVGV